jgi:hypothetical protein
MTLHRQERVPHRHYLPVLPGLPGAQVLSARVAYEMLFPRGPGPGRLRLQVRGGPGRPAAFALGWRDRMAGVGIDLSGKG